MIKIAATLLTTSCEIRDLKTSNEASLCTSMAADRLSALALMHIHYCHNKDYENTVQMLLNLHQRKITPLSLIKIDVRIWTIFSSYKKI